MYLEVAPSGGKWWRFKYRFEGKEKRLSLGVYPDVPLASRAGKKMKQPGSSKRSRGRAKGGTKPARCWPPASIRVRSAKPRTRREAAGRETNNFEDVAREWYGKQAHTWVAEACIGRAAPPGSQPVPEIGDTAIAEITAPILLAAVRKIEQRGAHDWPTGFCRWPLRCSATASLPGAASAIRRPTCAAP